jgi:hypothetical protein
MSKTPAQMRDKMASKGAKIVTKLGDKEGQNKVDKIRTGEKPAEKKEVNE